MEINTVKNRFLLTVLLLLFFSGLIVGQSRLYRPARSLKLNPLAFITHTPGIELGLEGTISENTSIHLGVSYLSDFGIFQRKDFEGYKLIGEYRIYNLFLSHNKNTYTSAQFHFKKAYVEGSTYVDRANGSYQQLYDVKAVNTSLDFLLANGAVVSLSQWASLDLSLVYGAKILSLDSDGLPNDAVFNLFDESFFNFTLNEIGSQWFPVFRMQAKLNFELN
ncbi:MAG: hypothetical protein AAF806_31995 [Bacteroidota bacterium]